MTKAEKKYLDRVANLGCYICGQIAEIHHIRTGQGLKRAKHDEVIPLCHIHHRTGGFGIAIHAGIKTWQDNFGNELDILEKIKKELA